MASAMLRSLWQRVSARSEAPRVQPTFAELYDENVDAVWRALRRLGVAEHQLEDAVQDVFLVVHRRADAFEARSSLRTWLFGIAHRVAADYRRARRRKGSTDPLDELADELADGSPNPESIVARERDRALVLRAIDQLEEEKRIVFTLAEIEGESVVDIAAALGLNTNTAYTRLRLARRDFQAALAALMEPAR